MLRDSLQYFAQYRLSPTVVFIRVSISEFIKGQVNSNPQFLADADILASFGASTCTDTTGSTVTSSTVYTANTVGP